MRRKVLEQLHHMEIKKTKWRAKATVFWSQINYYIEDMVRKCSAGQETQNKFQYKPMKASDVHQYQFQKVESDLPRQNGQSFIFVVD